MEDILYLVHRLPYPPNKGDKIRSFNLLKHLLKTYRVHVGAFVDQTAHTRDIVSLIPYWGSEGFLEMKDLKEKLF